MGNIFLKPWRCAQFRSGASKTMGNNYASVRSCAQMPEFHGEQFDICTLLCPNLHAGRSAPPQMRPCTRGFTVNPCRATGTTANETVHPRFHSKPNAGRPAPPQMRPCTLSFIVNPCRATGSHRSLRPITPPDHSAPRLPPCLCLPRNSRGVMPNSLRNCRLK